MDVSGIKYLGIDRILSRGTGETIAELNNALLVRDNVSGAYFLACEDEKTGITLLDRYIGSDCRLLMVSDYAIGQTAFARYGWKISTKSFDIFPETLYISHKNTLFSIASQLRHHHSNHTSASKFWM